MEKNEILHQVLDWASLLMRPTFLIPLSTQKEVHLGEPLQVKQSQGVIQSLTQQLELVAIKKKVVLKEYPRSDSGTGSGTGIGGKDIPDVYIKRVAKRLICLLL